ncbi:hypothetical protein [Nocardia asteroides]|uniref:hypothetical protein n=1 Tax=Nocardia asteroides TaxID=1824 RepID=UPI001E3DE58C|nr:hypothetical protein [Nocardia asteroides]UGT60150.1 hypothetical protein LTT61_23465 [Nocardia asteroides]
MLRVMLCGAGDTDEILDQFAETIGQIGGEPLDFRSGTIRYLNSEGSSWSGNSRLTVQEADLCVFVIVEQFGKITWEHEIREARRSGKPFIIMCLTRTYTRYLNLRDALTDTGAIRDEHDRRLLDLLRELEFAEYTVVTFTHANFVQRLKGQLATHFHVLLQDQQQRNRRAAIGRSIAQGLPLGAEERLLATRIAADEFEDKNLRKRAVSALAAAGVDADTALELAAAEEQGVQRTAISSFAELYRERPPDPDVLLQCVQIANASDDVGVGRRFVPVLLDIDLAAGVTALGQLDISEIGVRRRIAENLERYEQGIVDPLVRAEALALLARCLEDTAETGWKARCRQLRDRLSAS